jgi:hypothetical protein
VGICLALFPAIPAMFFTLGLRKRASCVEISDKGIRNPANGLDWLPWHRIISIREKKFLFKYEVIADFERQPIEFGQEIDGKTLMAEVLARAESLRETATGRRDFTCYSLPYLFAVFACCGLFMLLLVNGDVSIFMKVFGPILGLCVLATLICTPRRLRIDDRNITLYYPLWTKVIPCAAIQNLTYLGNSLHIAFKPRKSKQIWIHHDCLDAYLSVREALETARDESTMTA